MPEREDPRASLGVALDVDLERRPDALLAVALLNGFSARSEAERISLSISRPSLTTARLADVIAEFYSILPLNAGFSTVGMPDGALPAQDAPALAAVLARKNADETPVYPSNVRRLVDTADSAILMRNLLLAQQDGNSAVVLAGPATALAQLLSLYGARPQIAQKVKHLVLAAGAFPNGSAEPSIASDVAAARRLLSEWPTPLVAVGAELGEALRFPSTRLEEGLAWSAVHPVAAAYRALGRMPYDAPTTALAATLYAVHPDGGYFKLSEPGTIAVLEDGRTRFTPSPSGRHRYLIADPAQKERLLALYVSLVSAQPAPRPVRFKPPADVAQDIIARDAGKPPAAPAPPAAAASAPAAPGGTR
jgi:ABC-type transporter Mla MlaB component